jgi:hypothetical protein
LRAAVFDVSAFLHCLNAVGHTAPIRPFLSDDAFDPETIREMSLTLESVCSSLGLKVIDDAATRLVAEKIIALSQHGVRGVATLHAMTVKEFKSE